jgi:hypothetical protein
MYGINNPIMACIVQAENPKKAKKKNTFPQHLQESFLEICQNNCTSFRSAIVTGNSYYFLGLEGLGPLK